MGIRHTILKNNSKKLQQKQTKYCWYYIIYLDNEKVENMHLVINESSLTKSKQFCNWWKFHALRVFCEPLMQHGFR